MSKEDDTKNAYTQGILRAQIYIQENLDSKLSLKAVAKKAGFSPFHFHRIFHTLTNETLNSYVRRLRVEKAAGKVRYEKESITRIALDSGYETPSSFSQAFKGLFGKSPKEYRSHYEGDQLCNQPKERITMEKQIIEMEDMELLFVRKTGSYESSPREAFMALSQFIEQHPELIRNRRFGFSHDNPEITEEENLRFDACIQAPTQRLESGNVARTVLKGGRFAVIKHVGPYETLGDAFGQFFCSEWYIKHKEEIKDAPPFCEYLNMELVNKNPDALETLIYVPLKK